MSDTKILNNLAEKENSFNDEAEGSTALYYGELENVLTDEQFKKLAKLSKYNKYFKNKDLEKKKKILKDTNKKRGICRCLHCIRSAAPGQSPVAAQLFPARRACTACTACSATSSMAAMPR